MTPLLAEPGGPDRAAPVTALTGGLVITVDQDRRIIGDGTVAFDTAGQIVAVGPTSDVLSELHAAPNRSASDIRTVDCRRHVLTPGFIDAHVHLGEHLMRGLVPDNASPTAWLPDWLLPAYAALHAGDERLASELAFAELLLSGTTTVAEAGTLLHWEPVAAAAIEWGIRAQLGRWTWDLPSSPIRLATTTEAALANAADLVTGVGTLGAARLSAAVTVLGIGTCSERLLREAASVSRELGVPLATMHASVAAEHGGAPLSARQLEELGWITPRTKLVHAVYVSSDDIRVLSDGRVSVVHCPTAALRHAKGLSKYGRFPEMLARGIAVGLGGDSANGSNHLRMNDMMWLASALPKDGSMQTDVGAPETALEMATRHGARCLGLQDSVGSLEVGKQADIVAFSTDRPEWHPMLHPVQNLVLSAGAGSVKSVWVAGRQLVANGSLLHHDLAELLDRADDAARALIARSGLGVSSDWPLIFPPGRDRVQALRGVNTIT